VLSLGTTLPKRFSIVLTRLLLVATATTPDEVKQLGISGWVKYDEMAINGVTMHFSKKPKRFSNA